MDSPVPIALYAVHPGSGVGDAVKRNICVMAQLRQAVTGLSLRRPGFMWELVMGKMTLGRNFLRVFRRRTPAMLHTHSSTTNTVQSRQPIVSLNHTLKRR